MTRISPTERQAVIQTFSADFMAIESAFMGQLRKAFLEERSAVSAELGAVDETEIDRLEREAKEWERKLANFTSEVSMRIRMLREAQSSLRNVPENEWGLAPTGDQLLELKVEVPQYSRPTWNKIELKTRLDAETAIRLNQKIDAEVPMNALATIARAVQRELTFAGTLEKVREIYDQFHSLNFRKYGVDIAPKLSDIKSLGESTGMGMLAAAAVIDETQLALPAPKDTP